MAKLKASLLGKTFGFFIVTKDLGAKGTGPRRAHYWECTCKCGNVREMQTKQIRSKKPQRSCGCYMKSKSYSRKNKFWNGHEDIHGKWWQNVKRGALRRGHIFELNIADTWNLFLSQNKKCKLSGLDIGFALSSHDMQHGGTTASLDRIDSTKGYTIDNVQWVHKDINLMKQKFTQKYFLELCNLVSNGRINEN